MAKDIPAPARVLLFIAIAAVAWIAVLRVVGLGLPGLGLRNGSPYSEANYNWTLSDLDGASVDFREFQGKTVFLNFWATWCGPCVAEMPSISALASRSDLKDVIFLCVSLDGDPKEAKAFLQDRPMNARVLWGGRSKIPPAFQTEGIPATFVLTPDGKIAVAEVGSADWNTQKVADLLKQYAGSKS